MSDYNIGSNNRNSYSMVSRSSNPLESGVLPDKIINIKVENISNAKLIEDKELEEIIKPLQSIEDNSERLLLLESLKEPYLFTSKQLGTILLSMMSLKTRISIIEMLIPRVIDPTNTIQIKVLTDMFRFAADKAAIEDMFKKHANVLNKSQYVLQQQGKNLNSNNNSIGNNFQRRGSASGALTRGSSGFHSRAAHSLHMNKSIHHIQHNDDTNIMDDPPISSNSSSSFELNTNTTSTKQESRDALNAYGRFRQENSYVDQLINRIEANKSSQKPILPDKKQANYFGKYLEALKAINHHPAAITSSLSKVGNNDCNISSETDETVDNQNISSNNIKSLEHINNNNNNIISYNNNSTCPLSTAKLVNTHVSISSMLCGGMNEVEVNNLNTLIECSIQNLNTNSTNTTSEQLLPNNDIVNHYKIEFQRKIEYIAELEKQLLEQEHDHQTQLFELTSQLTLSESNLKYYLQSNQPSNNTTNTTTNNNNIQMKDNNTNSLDDDDDFDNMLGYREAVRFIDESGMCLESYAGPIIVRNDVTQLYNGGSSNNNNNTHTKTSSKTDLRGNNNNNTDDDFDPISSLLKDYSQVVAQLKCTDKELQYYKRLVINLEKSKTEEIISAKELCNKLVYLSIRNNNLEKLLLEALQHCIQLSVELKFEKELNQKLSNE